jgi:1-acyl-sn-glycerol-3-phosphate acyltransferase
MVITDTDARKRELGLSYSPEEEKELNLQKKEPNFLYKLLRYNPIDIGNDIWRKIVRKMNLSDQHNTLQYWAAYFYTRAVARMLWRTKIERVDNDLPPEYGPGILIGNHNSHLDPFFVAGAIHRGPVRWMSKEQNFKTPIVRTLFKNLGAFKVLRGQNDMKAWDKAKKILSEGGWVGIFPEGTRSINGEITEFHTGAVRLAIECGVPIVPSCVLGSKNALPKGKLVMKPAKVTIRVGKPVYYRDYIEGEITYEEAKKLSEELRQEVIKLQDGTAFKKEDIPSKLSIGSPTDIEKKTGSGGFMSKLKRLGKDILWGIDDIWYSFIKGLEVFGLRYQFQEAIQSFSGNIIHALSNHIMPYKTIDYDQYIPKEGAAVVCCNHNSEWDVIILATSLIQNGRVLYQMAKQSLFRVPVVNAWVRTHHSFPLKRGQSDVGSYLYAKDRLEAGEMVVVYPEGTTNNGGGELLPGHTGAMRLAIEAKVPIVLIGITGTEDIYPKHAKMLNFGKGCILKAGEPFMEHKKFWDSPKPPTYEELKELTDQMMARIKDLMLYDTPDA